MRCGSGLGAGLGLAMCLFAGAAAADSLALTDFNLSSTTSNVDSTLGWEFVANDDLSVESLGWWDAGGDGLSASHQVGLWTDGGTLLAQATVQAGTASDASGGTVAGGVFRFEPITAVDLTMGASYVLAGAIGTTDLPRFSFTGSMTTDPAISYTTARFGGSAFGFPGDDFSAAGYVGPNFTFSSVAPVPVPGALPFLALGVLAFGALRRRG